MDEIAAKAGATRVVRPDTGLERSSFAGDGDDAATAVTVTGGATGEAAAVADAPAATRKAAGDSGAAATKAPIVIGSVSDLTGPAGATQGPGVEALQVWTRMMNDRGGLNGHPIKLYVVDDASDPARHTAAVRDLVENKGAIAFVDQWAALAHNQGTADYLARKRVPVVGGENSSPLWNTNPMYFPQAVHPGHMRWGSLQLLKQHADGRTNIGVLVCQESPSCKQSQDDYVALAPEFGFKAVYQGRASFAQPDYTAECLSAKAADVEIFVTIMDINGMKRIARACSAQGFNPQYVLGYGISDNSFAPIPAYEGAVAVFPTFPFVDATSPAIQEYADAYRKYAPDVVSSPAGSLGWVAAKLFEKAAQGIGATPTSAQILEGLWAVKADTLGGLTGPLTFARDKAAPLGRCWFPMMIRNGKWVALDGTKFSCRP